MIEVNDLKKDYSGHMALDGVSFATDQGELFGLLGPNGAGKTTLIRLLCGNARRGSGTASICGLDVFLNPVKVKSKIGVVHQSNSLDNELTVWENLEVHGLMHKMSRQDRRDRIDEVLNFIALEEHRNRQVKKLSGGMKRRLMIGRALMHRPEVLFLDEPTVGLDPSIRRKIWALIRSISEAGATVLLTTHYIEEAEFLCRRVSFIDEGKIVSTDTPENFIRVLGKWAVDELVENELQSNYFDSRSSADEFAASLNNSFSIRRVNLEDVFLNLTGRKIVDMKNAGSGGAATAPHGAE